jgi:hypothetical protein
MSSASSGTAAVKQQQLFPGRLTAGLLGTAAALSLAFAQPVLAAEPFLKSTGEPRTDGGASLSFTVHCAAVASPACGF